MPILHHAAFLLLPFSKIQHIMDEMIATEREYARSLSYIIEHYFPEMERPDLPQDLRGKRSIIFGNLEKLCDFHSQYFLKDLESCAHSPLSISSCFLRHVSCSKDVSSAVCLCLRYKRVVLSVGRRSSSGCTPCTARTSLARTPC